MIKTLKADRHRKVRMVKEVMKKAEAHRLAELALQRENIFTLVDRFIFQLPNEEKFKSFMKRPVIVSGTVMSALQLFGSVTNLELVQQFGDIVLLKVDGIPVVVLPEDDDKAKAAIEEQLAALTR